MAKKFILSTLIIIITLLSLGLRIYAATRLNVDYDEPVYLGAALDYTNALRAGQYKLLAWYETTYEHPALYKILYGVVLLTQKPLEKFYISDLPRLAPIATTEAKRWNMPARYLSVVIGTLAVFVLACFNPIAGLFLGVSSLAVKYTSEVYLEALPLLTSLLAALAYLRWFKQVNNPSSNMGHPMIWLFLSAVSLGATAAGKYVYCVVGIAIVIHFVAAVLQKKVPRQASLAIIGWAVLSLVMFFIFNPYLWPHPWERLLKSITFNLDFPNSNIVKFYNYPFWQPVLWLYSFSGVYDLGPKSAFLFNIDIPVFVLALAGLPRLFQKERLFFFWLVTGLVFLLVWTTKWPQYALIILVPFVLSAALGILTLWDLAKNRFTNAK